MDKAQRFTGVAAVVAVWALLLTAVRLAGFDLLGEYPLSYLGTRPESAVLFTLGLVVPALLLTAFHGYVRTRFPVSIGFSIAMLVGLAGQMVAAFVPIGGDPTMHRLHTISALILGASLPLLMWRFAVTQTRALAPPHVRLRLGRGRRLHRRLRPLRPQRSRRWPRSSPAPCSTSGSWPSRIAATLASRRPMLLVARKDLSGPSARQERARA